MDNEMIFCQHCGNKIHKEAVVCPKCGFQVAELKTSQPVQQQPQVVINNSNTNTVVGGTKKCDKWVAFFLCLFLGVFGAHKFYEGKVGAGILYLFTAGLFGFGWFIDTIVILCKPNPYYV